MGKLAEKLKSFVEKFNGLSLTKKVVSGMLVFSVLGALVYFYSVSSTTKYTTIFSNLDDGDSKAVLDKLTAAKEPYKVVGSAIQIPDGDVATYRIQLLPTLTSGSKGFELLDSQSPFGMTDQQWSVDYQRALEGELERTLKGFSQVEGSRVHLVMPEDSAFVKDTVPSSASITLMLKSGNTLTNDQVKSIVALITGAVKNLKKENVSIVDNNMKLLTNNLYSADGQDASTVDQVSATANQLKIKSDYENKLEQKILAIVEPLAKNGNVKVKVNADMNFDSQQVDSKVVNSTGALTSESDNENTTLNGTATTGTSGTVDSNTNPQYPTTSTTGNVTGSTKAIIKNYDNGSTETKTAVAPGKVLRLTASAVFDSDTQLSTADTSVIQNLINNAIGFDASRNDTVTVASMKWSNVGNTAAVTTDLQAISAAAQQQTQQKIYQYVGIAAACFIVLIIIRLSFKTAKKHNEIPGLEAGGLDVLIGEEIHPKEPKKEIIFDPIDFEPTRNENTHMETEIRKYAKEKPEQVTDIVKAWLADEEE